MMYILLSHLYVIYIITFSHIKLFYTSLIDDLTHTCPNNSILKKANEIELMVYVNKINSTKILN